MAGGGRWAAGERVAKWLEGEGRRQVAASPAADGVSRERQAAGGRQRQWPDLTGSAQPEQQNQRAATVRAPVAATATDNAGAATAVVGSRRVNVRAGARGGHCSASLVPWLPGTRCTAREESGEATRPGEGRDRERASGRCSADVAIGVPRVSGEIAWVEIDPELEIHDELVVTAAAEPDNR